MFVLDKLGVNKEEMHHPYKHVLITKKQKPVLLDFERCHLSEKPKNVTQFCQCVASEYMKHTFLKKGIKVSRQKMIKAAEHYKKDMSRKNLMGIVGLVK